MVTLAAAAFPGAGSLYSLSRSLPEEAEVGDARSSKRSEQATEAEEACPAAGGEENKGTGVQSWTCSVYYITLAGGVLYMYCMSIKNHWRLLWWKEFWKKNEGIKEWGESSFENSSKIPMKSFDPKELWKLGKRELV
jgi:hypothetical protein